MKLDPELNRLSSAPWPGYALVRMDPSGKQVLFMFPRKNASNSLKQVLEKVSSFNPEGHWLTSQQVKNLPSSILRVAVVRDPLTRLQSAWRHAVVKHEVQFVHMEASGITKGISWENFVVIICKTSDTYTNYHMKSQSLELIDMVGRQMPDEILHVENLNAEWGELCRKHGWKWAPLGRLNESDELLQTPVSFEMHVKIHERYQKDYENFYPEKA